ncbi:MAG: Ppx/GppA family phosphatase [Nitrospirota bacterium]|nr:Ppx/GppA family phosphatase [Nitrospirota bacterium]MDH5698971.1 Ppx/GppA family phosphatase [Nitrospirota bacterium]
MLLAGIDIGTLTCRLLVAEVNPPSEFRVVDADRRILRLGEGVDQYKRLSDEAMDRVVAKLKEWREKTAKYSLDGVVVVATSAVRESENRQEFLTRVKQETGWDVEILSGAEEARRTLLGIRFGLPPAIKEFLGLDIGGGSTECILAQEGKAPAVISLDLGVVRLLERVFRQDPPAASEIHKAEAVIDQELANVSKAFGSMPRIPLVGTAGTVTTLAAMAQGLPRYESARVHNYELPLSTIKRLEQDLITKVGPQRLAMPGLEPGREYVIVVGTIILRRVMETFGFETCLVSDFGLREGILVDLATKRS